MTVREHLSGSLVRLLAAVEAEELQASTAMRYRIEGAIVALEALGGSDPSTILGTLGLKVIHECTDSCIMVDVQQVERASDPQTFVGYIRVSTDEQARSGAGLGAQRTTIEAEAARRGWTLSAIFEDAGTSAKSLSGRPALGEALSAIESGAAHGLIVSKLDRLSRSVVDAAGLLERSQRAGWSLVCCDLGVDTSTPAGEAMASVMATFAQLERRLIGQRTKEALAVKRAQGVQLGRPREVPSKVVTRIVKEHDKGLGWTAIARKLDAEGVPTAHGGTRWFPSTVRSIYQSAKSESER